jgi:SAM-dependent methyltransferase
MGDSYSYNGRGFLDRTIGFTPKNEIKAKLVPSLRREWSKFTTTEVQRCSDRLNKVSFMHGDMADLAKQGKFGLFYLSNALEHYDRTNRNPLIEGVNEVVRPGGFVVLCHRPYGASPGKKGPDGQWRLVNSIKGRDDANKIAWTYSLYQTRKGVKKCVKPLPDVAPAVPPVLPVGNISGQYPAYQVQVSNFSSGLVSMTAPTSSQPQVSPYGLTNLVGS